MKPPSGQASFSGCTVARNLKKCRLFCRTHTLGERGEVRAHGQFVNVIISLSVSHFLLVSPPSLHSSPIQYPFSVLQTLLRLSLRSLSPIPMYYLLESSMAESHVQNAKCVEAFTSQRMRRYSPPSSQHCTGAERPDLQTSFELNNPQEERQTCHSLGFRL